MNEQEFLSTLEDKSQGEQNFLSTLEDAPKSDVQESLNSLLVDKPPEKRQEAENKMVRSLIYSHIYDVPPGLSFDIEPRFTEERNKRNGVTRSFEKITFSEKMINLQNAEARGMAAIPAGILKSIAIAAKDLDDVLPRVLRSYEDKDLQDLVAYKAGQAIGDWANKMFPQNPALQRSFVFNTLPEGMGQMVGFIGGGIAGRMAKVPQLLSVMLLGASVEAPVVYEDALAHGADEEVARKAARWGGTIGTTEAAPIARIFNRFDKATGGGLKRFLIEALKGGFEEWVQESFQTGAENVLARKLYDSNRKLFEGVVEAGGAGGILGFIMNAVAMGLGIRIRGKKVKAPVLDDFLKEGQTVEEALKPLLSKEELAELKVQGMLEMPAEMPTTEQIDKELAEWETNVDRVQRKETTWEAVEEERLKGKVQGRPIPEALGEFKEKVGVPREEPKIVSDVLKLIVKEGGINPDLAQGEMARFTIKEAGYPRLVSRKGLNPDMMRERLQEAGYLSEDSTTNDLYDLMDLELYRYKYGKDVEDLFVTEVMADEGSLDVAIKEAEKGIKKAYAQGLREGVEKEKVRKKGLEQKKKARQQARQFIKKMARVIMRPVGKSVDFYYREAIDSLRVGIDPSFRAKKTLEDRERTQRFLELHPEKLEDMPISLLKRINKKALNQYTMGELEAIAVETVRLRRQGKLKKDIKKAQEQRQLEGEVDEITFNVFKGTEIEPSKEPITSVTAREARPRRIRAAARANTLRPTRIFDKLDGGQQFHGPTHMIFYDQVNDEVNASLKDTDERLDRGKARQEELGLSIEVLTKERQVGSWKGTTEEMIGVYAGIKNPRNHLAIIYGNHITLEQAQKIVDAMTSEEKALGDFVIEEYGDNYLRLREEKIKYDGEDIGHELNYIAMRRKDITYNTIQAEIAGEFLHRSYLRKGYTPRGFSIARQDIPAEYQMPVDLRIWSVWLEQVSKQEQFIHLGNLTKHLHRIVGHTKFKTAVRQEFGEEYVKVIDNYVSRVANPNIYKTFDTIHRYASMARQNVAMAYLAYNLVTMGKQLPSVALYLADAGPGHLIGAAFEFITDPVGTIKFLEKSSKQLSWRHRSMERELEELKTHERGKFEQFRKRVGRIGMMGIYAFDRLAICIGFRAVYNRAIADGYSEVEAIKMAEHSTLRTQPAAHAKDVAQIYASNEFLNWFTQFTNQLNQIYNIATYDIPTTLKKGKYYDAFLGTLSMAIVALVIWMMVHRRLPEDVEDLIEAAKEQAMNAVPIVGKVISSAATGWRSSQVPMLKGAEAIGVFVGNTSDDRKIKALLEGMAVTLGIPYTGPKRVIKTITEGDVKELVGGKPRGKKKSTRKVRKQRED